MLAVAADDQVAGWIAVRHVLRPKAKTAMALLKQQDLRLVMLTGDNPKAAADIGVAMGATGTDVALEASDITFKRPQTTL